MGTWNERLVYPGMKRITLTVTYVLLAVPAAAFGKTGINFKEAPESTNVGDRNNFQIILMREPRDPTGQATPMSGVHPLVIFRSESGKVLRVRGQRVGDDGVSNASVVFTDKGPWHARLSVGGKLLPDESEPSGFGIGTGLIDTTPAVHKTPMHQPAADNGNGVIWILLGLAAA